MEEISVTPTQYIATLRQRWHPDGYSDAEIASWLADESRGLFDDLHEDLIRQPTCTAVDEVTHYADFLSACVRQFYNRSHRGRPRGSAYVRDRADLEKRLIPIITYMHTHQYSLARETIACALRITLKTPESSNGLAHVVKWADRERPESKAAISNLTRWCNDYGTQLDRLIQQVTTS
jgi:hypothetical protein